MEDGTNLFDGDSSDIQPEGFWVGPREDGASFFAAQGVAPFFESEFAAAPVMECGLEVAPPVNPFGTSIGLLSIVGKRQADGIAVGGVDELDAAGFADGGAAGGSADIGFDDDVFAGAFVPFHFQVAETAVVDAFEEPEGFLQDGVVSTLFA